MNILLLMVALAAPAEAPRAGVDKVAAADAAATTVTVAGEVAPAAAAVAAGVGVEPITSAAAASPRVEIPPRTECPSCALVDLFTRNPQFLSGLWGAARRLQALRKRGDEEAARHLEPTMDQFVAEAVGGGE